MDQDKELKSYDEYSLDDWIVFIAEKIETTDDPGKKIEYRKTLDEMIQIRDSESFIDDSIFTSIGLINKAMEAVFEDWQYYTIDFDDSIVLYNDIIYITLYSDGDNVHCDLGFGFKTEAETAAEITLILSSIFGLYIGIIHGCFYCNDLDNTFIWGKEEIKKHLNTVKGYRKIYPVILFDDENIGNC